MKFSVECRVKSKTEIGKKLNYKEGKFEYSFIPNDKGILEKINITVKVDNPEKFKSEIKPSQENGVSHIFNVGGDKELFDLIIDQFQTLESAYAVQFGVKKIYWESTQNSVIPETEEEKLLVQISSTTFEEKYPDPIVQVKPQLLFDVIQSLDDYKELKILLGFYREGKLEYSSLRYINSFYNFYFVLEGLYGNGKTQNNDVQKEFMKSKEFDNVISLMLDSFNTHLDKKQEIETKLKEHSKKLDKDGLIHLLLGTRGDLHHFNPKRIKGTPFNHKDFHLMSWVSMGLSLHSLLRKIVIINRKRNGMTI